MCSEYVNKFIKYKSSTFNKNTDTSYVIGFSKLPHFGLLFPKHSKSSENFSILKRFVKWNLTLEKF